MRNPKVIGLTGGIASGKSTVSGQLAGLGAHVIDADSVGHAVLRPDGEAYPEVVAAFGTGILDEDGTISRKNLGAIVFADGKRLKELNAISHPRMAERMAREIEAVRRGVSGGGSDGDTGAEPPRLIVLDAAILFEAGWDALCGEVWTVEAPAEVTLPRLMERSGLERGQAQARLDAQMSNGERARRAGKVIVNEGTLPELEALVTRLWEAALTAE